MKKFIFAFAIVATLVVALLSTGQVFAQGSTPPTPQTPGSGFGRGMMGGRGAGMGAANKAGTAGQGLLHDTMISVFAQKLGISVDDLNARLTKGETMAQIASSKGLTAEQFSALLKDARSQVIEQAVKDGTLTQAQADWMKQRGSMGNGAGRGMGRGNSGNCPYFPQSKP